MCSRMCAGLTSRVSILYRWHWKWVARLWLTGCRSDHTCVDNVVQSECYGIVLRDGNRLEWLRDGVGWSGEGGAERRGALKSLLLHVPLYAFALGKTVNCKDPRMNAKVQRACQALNLKVSTAHVRICVSSLLLSSGEMGQEGWRMKAMSHRCKNLAFRRRQNVWCTLLLCS
jgi:hypothetical protein